MMTPEPSPGWRIFGAGSRALGTEELIEEVLEERIVAAGRHARLAARPGTLDGAEVHDGGAHVLGDADEALLERFRQGEAR